MAAVQGRGLASWSSQTKHTVPPKTNQLWEYVGTCNMYMYNVHVIMYMYMIDQS